MRWNPANPITVDITPSRVTFIDPDGPPVDLLPVLYLTPDSRRMKVASVGAPPTDGPGVPVELFSADTPPPGISKLECLAAFFTHGLKVIVDRCMFRVKPTVHVRGHKTVSNLFGGFERDLLRLALERAGGKQVLWPEDEP